MEPAPGLEPAASRPSGLPVVNEKVAAWTDAAASTVTSRIPGNARFIIAFSRLKVTITRRQRTRAVPGALYFRFLRSRERDKLSSWTRRVQSRASAFIG